MTNYEQIKSAIMDSSLDSSDKLALIEAFADISDTYLADPAELISHDPSLISMINENRKQKIQAFSTSDTALWKQILDDEHKKVSAMTYDLD